jgi:DNA-binding PadR family transcriptional regulator
MHGYELAKKVGIPVTGIYQHLRELSHDGVIDFETSGRRKQYFLTRRGEKLLEAILVE